MSSRSNMSQGACANWRPSWRAFTGRVERHILLNFLQTGARRADEREWQPHRYCIRARDRPGIYLVVSEAPQNNEELRMATAAHALTPLPQLSRDVADWVNSVRELTQPRAVHWCEGTDAEARELTGQLLRGGELTALNPEYFPGCHLYRSAPGDVARVEHLTYICTRSQEDAGPNNHWMDPQQAHSVCDPVLHGADRLATGALRRGDHRQRLRRAQHADHDARRPRRARAYRARRGFRARLALRRRARSRAPLHHALSRGTRDRELRLRLRRQRAARQEVPRAADRQLAGAHRGLARRAHADRGPAEPARRDALSRLRLPIGVRQDQSRHADSAGFVPGLARVHSR